MGPNGALFAPTLKGGDGRPRLLVHEYPWVRRALSYAGAQSKGLHDLGDEVALIFSVLE